MVNRFMTAQSPSPRWLARVGPVSPRRRRSAPLMQPSPRASQWRDPPNAAQQVTFYDADGSILRAPASFPLDRAKQQSTIRPSPAIAARYWFLGIRFLVGLIAASDNTQDRYSPSFIPGARRRLPALGGGSVGGRTRREQWRANPEIGF